MHTLGKWVSCLYLRLVVCTQLTGLTPSCSIFDLYNCTKGVLSSISSINITSSAKAIPANAWLLSVPLPAISLIFCVQLYKFRRQFQWYLAFCATMSPVFSCVRRSMSSRIGAHNLTVSPVWMLQLHENQQYQERLCRRSISVLGVSSQYLMIVTDIKFTCGHQLPLHWHLFSDASSQLYLTLSCYTSACRFLVLCIVAASEPLASSNQFNRKEFGSNLSSLSLLICPERML